MAVGHIHAFFCRYAIQKIKRGFTRLHAILARQVFAVHALLVVGDAQFLDPVLKELRDVYLLVNTPITVEIRSSEVGLNGCAVARAAEARFALHEGVNDAMHVTHRCFCAPDGQQCWLVKYLAEIDGGIGAVQIDGQPEAFGQGFLMLELNHVETWPVDNLKRET